MTYITKMDTFDAVAAAYAATKPLVSKNHSKQQDVRPIGDRSRKWERISKIDDNCYIFTCGGYADPVFTWGGSAAERDAYPLTTEEVVMGAPIVWRRHPDGTETITVRNGAGQHTHNSTYSFISRALPRELWFKQSRIGKQFIYIRPSGTTVHLPKTRTVPKHMFAYFENAVRCNPGGWASRKSREYVLGDDGLSVTFKRLANGGFEVVGEPPKLMVSRKRVDRGLKKEFKAHIDTLYDWALTMYPMMRAQLNWSFRHEQNKAILEIGRQHKIEGVHHTSGSILGNADKALVRSIIADPEHPMRYGLGVAAMFAIRDADNATADSDPLRDKHIRKHFVRWINNLGGFAETIQVEK